MVTKRKTNSIKKCNNSSLKAKRQPVAKKKGKNVWLSSAKSTLHQFEKYKRFLRYLLSDDDVGCEIMD